MNKSILSSGSQEFRRNPWGFPLLIFMVCVISTNRLRVRVEINLHFQKSRRPHGKARGGRIAGYLTDAKRSQAGWIGSLKCEVIFERALRIGVLSK